MHVGCRRNDSWWSLVRVVVKKTASELKNKKTKTRDIQLEKNRGPRESSHAPFVVVVCSDDDGHVWMRLGAGSCVLTRQ
jgi:hypothetical protein